MNQNYMSMKVKVHRCLVDKPQYSEIPGFGWIVDTVVDPSKREPCGAIGKVGRTVRGAEIVPVLFLTPYPDNSRAEALRETCLFAHVDDLESTDEAFSWPDVPGMIVHERINRVEMSLSEQEFVKVAADAMSDETPIQVEISIKDAWILISAVQLAHRHPGIHRPMKRAIKAIADRFTDLIVERHPEARTALRMGWNPAFDVERKED